MNERTNDRVCPANYSACLNTTQHDAMQCNAMQCNAMQCKTMQCNERSERTNERTNERMNDVKE